MDMYAKFKYTFLLRSFYTKAVALKYNSQMETAPVHHIHQVHASWEANEA